MKQLSNTHTLINNDNDEQCKIATTTTKKGLPFDYHSTRDFTVQRQDNVI